MPDTPDPRAQRDPAALAPDSPVITAIAAALRTHYGNGPHEFVPVGGAAYAAFDAARPHLEEPLFASLGRVAKQRDEARAELERVTAERDAAIAETQEVAAELADERTAHQATIADLNAVIAERGRYKDRLAIVVGDLHELRAKLANAEQERDGLREVVETWRAGR